MAFHKQTLPLNDDNAPIHREHAVKMYMEKNDVDVT